MAFPWHDVTWVLLDMDGTLLDKHFDDYFWETLVPQEFARQQGLALAAARQEVFARYQREEGTLNWTDIDFWSRELELDIPALKEGIRHLIEVHPDTEAFLQYVRGLKKHVALVTNAHWKTLSLKMNHTGLLGYFDAVVSSFDLGYPKEELRFWEVLQSQLSRAGDGQDEARLEVLPAELVPVGAQRQLAFRRRHGVLDPAGQVARLLFISPPDDLLEGQLETKSWSAPRISTQPWPFTTSIAAGSDWMNDYFNSAGAAMNVTPSAVYESQGQTTMALGGFSYRAPQRATNLFSFSPPGYKAGCGGIDAWLGAYGFVNMDAFVNALRNIGQNAVGYFLQLALKTMAPEIDGLLTDLSKTMNQLNQFQIGSCQAIKQYVGTTPDTRNMDMEQRAQVFGWALTGSYGSFFNAKEDTQTSPAHTKAAYDAACTVNAALCLDSAGNPVLKSDFNLVYDALERAGGYSNEEIELYISLFGTITFIRNSGCMLAASLMWLIGSAESMTVWTSLNNWLNTKLSGPRAAKTVLMNGPNVSESRNSLVITPPGTDSDTLLRSLTKCACDPPRMPPSDTPT